MMVAGGSRFRGIRFISASDPEQLLWGATAIRPEGLLLDSRVREGFAQLAPRGALDVGSHQRVAHVLRVLA